MASLASRPDPAAYTLAHYQALPVAHHQLEEATYESEALGVDDIVGWAAPHDPSPDVIHIDMRSPTRNSYLGGRGWATTLWRELRRQLPTLKFLHLTPLPSSVDQLLNSMRNNPVGKPKDAPFQVYPTTNLVHTPPPAIWCACRILLQVHQQTTLFSPFLGILPTPGGGMIWASPLSIPPPCPTCTSPTSPTPPSIAQLLCNGTVVPHAPIPSFPVNPPSAPNPFLTPLMG